MKKTLITTITLLIEQRSKVPLKACGMFAVLMLFMVHTSALYAQSTITVSGTVIDENGVPMPGVNVIQQNTSHGVTTDFDGKFTLDVNEGATVEFSYIGYNKYILADTSGAMNNLEIKLEPDTSELDEVVVIGYSTQSKKDLTGAVATVSSEDIAQRNVTNISQAIQGAMPGVTVTKNGSAPGSSASIRVRGITTLQGNTSPLILVDDVPVGSLDDINPNDVESISVLKDAAAAAIYGSRAAAGVVIVTTKRGKEGVFKINYSGTQIVNTPTEIRSTVGALRYMEMNNEMSWNDAGNGNNEFPVYSKDFIDSYLENHEENPDEYPLTDYKDLILKDYAFGYRHNLTISGGGEKVKTLASMGYEKQEALYDHREWKRYTARVNTDIKLSDKFGANLNISGRLGDAESPVADPTNLAIESPSIFPAVWQDGRIAGGKQGENIYAELHHGGFTNTDTYQFFGKFGVYYAPVKGLKISLNVSPRYNFTRYKSFNRTIPYWDYDDPQMTGTPNYIQGHNVLGTSLIERRTFYKALTTQALVNYDRSFGKHRVEALLGFEEFSSEDEVLGVEGREYDVAEYPFLNQAPVDKVFNDNTSISELAYSSHFGRVAYNYDSKYYAQVNVRRDASSRFGSDYRWGTFPSVSLGWVPSNEDFFSGLNSPVSFLKFRGSYGKLGNDRLGNYLYLSVLQFSNTLFANGSEVESLRTAAQRFLAINDITWESTTTLDLGIDMSLFDNKLSITADYYDKETKDMLLNLSIPDFSGYEDPTDNVGTMDTKGWEIAVSWKDRIGQLKYSAAFNMFDSKSVIGDIAGKRIIGNQTISQEGDLYNAWYGYKSDGIYQTQEEVNNSATTSDNVGPGDIRYMDISGPDGEPDGIINELDRTQLGGSTLPRYEYGGNIRLEYKGFDLGLAFQGVGKQKAYLKSQYVQPLYSGWKLPPAIIDGNYWSVYNSPDENARAAYPRLSSVSKDNNYRFSDFWLIDGSYFRMKNITVGYSLPGSATDKMGISGLRIYLSGNDLFSIDNYPEGIDPEDNTGYLFTRSFLVGINVNL